MQLRMGRSLRALKSPTLSVTRSNISYLTEIPRQKQELGRWHNQDPVEFLVPPTNWLESFSLFLVVAKRMQSQNESVYAKPSILLLYPVPRCQASFLLIGISSPRCQQVKPLNQIQLCALLPTPPSFTSRIIRSKSSPLSEELSTLCAVLVCLLEALSLPWKMNGMLSIVPSLFPTNPPRIKIGIAFLTPIYLPWTRMYFLPLRFRVSSGALLSFKEDGILKFWSRFFEQCEAHLLRDLDVKEEAAPDHQNPSSSSLALSWAAAVSH